MAACTQNSKNASSQPIYSPDLPIIISESKLFLVGAGGIGCELLKNLVMIGFKDIHVIDLDTIDVSNLNRQFLFRKEHVGKSKAEVAQQSVLNYNKDTKVTAYHDSIFNPDFDVQFFKQFHVIMNALDNKAARNHVNRMSLAAKVPLVEAGTAGYLGQVQVIQRGVTECYECQPKPAQKTFPGCTIRNTPSEPIHCIVWAKHLFNQLFGEEDPDQDVSPDTEDPELAGEAGSAALNTRLGDEPSCEIQRKSTRQWALETGYSAEKLFNKLFRDDVKYLLSMENLWKSREPPEPLDFSKASLPTVNEINNMNGGFEESNGLQDQKIWNLLECSKMFERSLNDLKAQLSKTADGTLIWDKDDPAALDFVVSTANLRMIVFHIARKSRFDVKSMAGNIIPAIATTNAVVAGVQVMECLKVLSGRIDQCKSTYLVRKPNPNNLLLNPCMYDKPNPKCYVCSSKPEVILKVNPTMMTLTILKDKVLKGELGMQAPDVEMDDGKGTILISSEEGETTENERRNMSEFGIRDGSRLKCDDFLQDYTLVIIVNAVESVGDDELYKVIVDKSQLNAKPEVQRATEDSEDDMEILEEPMRRKRMASPTSTDETTKRCKQADTNSMENARWTCNRVIHGQFWKLFYCCFKKKSSEDIPSLDEKIPFVSKPQNSNLHKSCDELPSNGKKSSRRASLRPAHIQGSRDTIDFWIPEIHGVQPEREDYFKQSSFTATCDSPISSPNLRRNTMPTIGHKRVASDVGSVSPQLYRKGSYKSENGSTSSTHDNTTLLVDSEPPVAYLRYKVVTISEGDSCMRSLHFLDLVDLPLMKSEESHFEMSLIKQPEGKLLFSVSGLSVTDSSIKMNKNQAVTTVTGDNYLQVSVQNVEIHDCLLALGHCILTEDDLKLAESCTDDKPAIKALFKTTKKQHAGIRVLMTLNYNRLKQNLQLCAEKLDISSSKNDYSDKYMYIKITLYYKGKRVRSVKISPFLVKLSKKVYFPNKQISFSTSCADLDECVVVLSLMERSVLRQDLVIGRAITGPHLEMSDGTLTRWGLIAEGDHPVTSWYNL